MIPIVDFLRQNNSNLLDFVGFSGDKTFFNKEFHPEHKDYIETTIKIRKGQLF